MAQSLAEKLAAAIVGEVFMRRGPVQTEKPGILGTILQSIVDQSEVRDISNQITQTPEAMPNTDVNGEVVRQLAQKQIAETFGITAASIFGGLLQPLKPQNPLPEEKPNQIWQRAKNASIWSFNKAKDITTGAANGIQTRGANRAATKKALADAAEVTRKLDEANRFKQAQAAADILSAEAAERTADAARKVAEAAEAFANTQTRMRQTTRQINSGQPVAKPFTGSPDDPEIIQGFVIE